MIRLIALILCMAPASLRAEGYPALHDVVGVSDGDVLNIRAAASSSAPIIATLAPDATDVEVVAVEGKWAVINTDEGSGYAALRYLAPVAGPDWAALETPLSCLGTEPFWSLEIDPARSETRFQTPDANGAQVAALVARWPGRPWSATAAVGLPGGLAVMAPAECSDGMSDRRYGIAVDIFLQGPGRARLSGCCSLTQP